MKKLSLVGLIILICTYQISAQTIRIANNNPGATGGTNVYTGPDALQDAIDAAVSGDIIHVVPSPDNYDDGFVENKSLTFIGIGLDPSGEIGLRSIVDEIRFNQSGSSGSRVSGLHARVISMAISITVSHTVSNILIENCQLDRVQGAGYASGSPNSISGLIVRNCVINSSNSTSDAQGFELYNSSGVIIENNIIKGRCCTAGTVQGNGMTVQNNLFFNGASGIALHDIDNSVIRNNIFLNATPGSWGGIGTDNTYLNNISYNTSADAFPIGTNGNTGSGNLEGVDPMLTNVPETTGDWDFDYDITPMAGSPVLNAGTDGTDIGPTGGSNPFDPEGTYLPIIESLTLPTVITQGVDLQVNIKAKGN